MYKEHPKIVCGVENAVFLVLCLFPGRGPDLSFHSGKWGGTGVPGWGYC